MRKKVLLKRFLKTLDVTFIKIKEVNAAKMKKMFLKNFIKFIIMVK